MKYNRIDIK